MDIVHIKRYTPPKYPDKNMVLQNPDLLKTIPQRWRDNIYVGTALSSLLMFTFSGCTPKGIGSIDGKTVVAPIFEHGTGRGSFGCSSIAPPAFISEEEAFQVVQEEGMKYGISFTKDGLELKNVSIPETKYELKSFMSSENYKPEINTSHKGNLVLDGYDEEKKIGFEFISTEDYEQWQVKSSSRSTVDDFDFLATAKLLQNGIKGNSGAAAIGTFYNPMGNIKVGEAVDIKTLRAYTTQVAKEDLRMQVKGFLQWLKAQGII